MSKRKEADKVFWDLGKTKRVTISEFKGQQYVDIREYYTDKETNELKPGKKGISLNKEQFELLAGAIDDIRDALPTSTSNKKARISSTVSSS